MQRSIYFIFIIWFISVWVFRSVEFSAAIPICHFLNCARSSWIPRLGDALRDVSCFLYKPCQSYSPSKTNKQKPQSIQYLYRWEHVGLSRTVYHEMNVIWSPNVKLQYFRNHFECIKSRTNCAEVFNKKIWVHEAGSDEGMPKTLPCLYTVPQFIINGFISVPVDQLKGCSAQSAQQVVLVWMRTMTALPALKQHCDWGRDYLLRINTWTRFLLLTLTSLAFISMFK